MRNKHQTNAPHDEQDKNSVGTTTGSATARPLHLLQKAPGTRELKITQNSSRVQIKERRTRLTLHTLLFFQMVRHLPSAATFPPFRVARATTMRARLKEQQKQKPGQERTNGQ